MNPIFSSSQLAEVPPDEGEQTVAITVDGPNEPELSDGVVKIPTEDGGVVISFGNRPDRESGHYDNLAIGGDSVKLQVIAENLLQGIEADDRSRQPWLSDRDRGIDMLGLKLEDPRGDVGSSSAPLEGQSVARHPILAQSVLNAQATACGELLPASGPAKCVTIGEETEKTAELAEALEADINDYLTDKSPEYYPDTRRTLFWSSFGGSGFKKVFNCPLRRRPVSESIDAKDLIMSAAATDLMNLDRLTHQILMRPSVMKRMQMEGIYRNVPLGQPNYDPNIVEEKQAEIEGISPRFDRPEDQPYTVYECYCELDLDEFAPKQFKDKGIPLPYRVTIEKNSRTLLEIRRNWDEGDEQCMPKRVFVKYPYVEAMGIYGIGLLHILGNSAMALTAAWRIMLDNGMFANFPGGVVDKAASKQLTNEFRVPPGGMVQLDFGGRNFNQVMGNLPYRNLDAVFVQFITNVQETVQKLAGSAEIPVGEGKADVPVGTIIAQIEQATKLESEVHKGLHSAQSVEFKLLKERFREDPGALWRHNPKSKVLETMMRHRGLEAFDEQDEQAEQKRADLFLEALDTCEIVPAADPNSASHLHRVMKWTALKQLTQGNPKWDQDKIDQMGVRLLGFDPLALANPNPVAPPQDPKLLAEQNKSKANDIKAAELAFKQQTFGQTQAQEAAAQQSDERIQMMRLAMEKVIHESDASAVEKDSQRKLLASWIDHQTEAQKQHAALVKHGMDKQHDLVKHREGIAADLIKHNTGIAADHQQHGMGLLSDHIKQIRDHQHQRLMGEQNAARQSKPSSSENRPG